MSPQEKVLTEMTSSDLVIAAHGFAQRLLSRDLDLEKVVRKASLENGWFTEKQILGALDAIAKEFLTESKLKTWLDKYDFTQTQPKKVGLILAGNIPAVGFHDCLGILASPHKGLIKLSSKDSVLIPFLIDGMMEGFDRDFGDKIQYVERLSGYDAVIATGGDTSVEAFKQYFSSVPNIVRGHRNSVAILTGQETDQQILSLGHDVYVFFGLGCRNVSKLFVPSGYDVIDLLKIWDVNFKEVMDHHKYKNNYDYSLALTIMQEQPHFQGDTIILIRSNEIHSRLATLHYQVYADHSEIEEALSNDIEKIQCIVGSPEVSNHNSVAFGSSQRPGLMDYADNVDTMSFLASL